MIIGKGLVKGSNIGGKPTTKGKHGSKHTKKMCLKLHGRENVQEHIGENKGTHQMGKQ